MANLKFDSSFTKEDFTQAVISNFSKRSQSYNCGPSGEMKRHHIETLLTFFPPLFPTLDIACGTGLLGAHLGTGLNVTGIDITDAMLAVARRNCPEGRFVNASADNLPFDDCSFGCAYICSALVYFPDVPAALREAFRVLKVGGFLAYQAVTLDSYIAGVVLEKAIWELLGKERGRYVFETPHAITNDEAANRKLVESAGFVDVTLEKHVVVDHMDITALEKWWEGVVCGNGFLRRVAAMDEDELRAIHDLWIDGMERRRGADNKIEDRITSWYVRAYKRNI